MIVALDHVHVHVADREAAAAWYARVLGLQRDGRLARWADDRTQPLFVGSPHSRSCLALFEHTTGTPPRSGDHTVGFRVDGAAFLAFLERLDELALVGRDTPRLTRADAVDHGAAWSLHFVDPDGNHIELTSYDHERIGEALAQAGRAE